MACLGEQPGPRGRDLQNPTAAAEHLTACVQSVPTPSKNFESNNPIRPGSMSQAKITDWQSESEDESARSIAAGPYQPETPLRTDGTQPRLLHSGAKGVSKFTGVLDKRGSGRAQKRHKEEIEHTREPKVRRTGPRYQYRTTTKPLSMTPGAIDHRKRKDIQKHYQRRLEELLSPDIITKVEGEGGITPLGRLFKAAVLELEGQKTPLDTDKVSLQAPIGDKNETLLHLEMENNQLKDKIRGTCKLLRELVGQLQDDSTHSMLRSSSLCRVNAAPSKTAKSSW